MSEFKWVVAPHIFGGVELLSGNYLSIVERNNVPADAIKIQDLQDGYGYNGLAYGREGWSISINLDPPYNVTTSYWLPLSIDGGTCIVRIFVSERWPRAPYHVRELLSTAFVATKMARWLVNGEQWGYEPSGIRFYDIPCWAIASAEGSLVEMTWRVEIGSRPHASFCNCDECGKGASREDVETFFRKTFL